MGETTTSVFLLLVLFQIKHMFADFYLQTPRMLEGRETYIHRGRAEHAGVHALFSVIVFLLMGTSVMVTLVIVVAEWIVHFHIDWAKAKHSVRRKQTPAEAGFWRAMGADQACHQLTYLAMAWIWVLFAAP